jgi:peptidoglycan/xylan/chitin deacetylase (PgdA/CDA1 family)
VKNKKKKVKTKKSKIIKAIACTLALIVVLYVLVPFRTTPYSANYYVECPYTNGETLVALTFDDGPSDYTMDLLEGLKKNNAKATFFVLGYKVAKNADVVKTAYDNGNLIANHTYKHTSMFEQSIDEFQSALDKTDDEIEKVIGERTSFYRPPHGYYTGRTMSKIDKIAVLWTYDSTDWKYQDADYVYKYVMNHAEDGAIILLHDTKKTTVEGVLRAIDELSAQGVKFVRADELLCRNGDKLKAGVAYRQCSANSSPFYF